MSTNPAEIWSTRRNMNSPKRFWNETRLPFSGVELPLLLVSDGDALTGVSFGPAHPGDVSGRDGWVHDPGPLADAEAQLAEYAEGTRTVFTVPLQPAGSAFQQEVWYRLLEVPYGATTTYGRVAAEVGRPKSARAVGAAVGSNPIGIIIPCHRVIGADGSLTGYGGGLDNKVALLRLEGVAAL